MIFRFIKKFKNMLPIIFYSLSKLIKMLFYQCIVGENNIGAPKMLKGSTVIIVRVPSIEKPVFFAQHRPERDRHTHIE